MTIRSVAEAAESYVQSLERLREAIEADNKARQAVSHLAYAKEEAAGYRQDLQEALAEALKAEEIP